MVAIWAKISQQWRAFLGPFCAGDEWEFAFQVPTVGTASSKAGPCQIAPLRSSS